MASRAYVEGVTYAADVASRAYVEGVIDAADVTPADAACATDADVAEVGVSEDARVTMPPVYTQGSYTYSIHSAYSVIDKYVSMQSVLSISMYTLLPVHI